MAIINFQSAQEKEAERQRKISLDYIDMLNDTASKALKQMIYYRNIYFKIRIRVAEEKRLLDD